MSAVVLNVNVALVHMGPCWKCGIVYAVPDHFEKKRREERSTFYCPNGHPAVFKKSQADVLRELLDEERRRKEWAERGRDSARRSARAYKGKVTEIKNRVRNGVCPFCKRSFENLRRHMETKHSDCDDGEKS